MGELGPQASGLGTLIVAWEGSGGGLGRLRGGLERAEEAQGSAGEPQGEGRGGSGGGLGGSGEGWEGSGGLGRLRRYGAREQEHHYEEPTCVQSNPSILYLTHCASPFIYCAPKRSRGYNKDLVYIKSLLQTPIF